MALGALIWIAGEMYAVKKGEDTTTSYVRRLKIGRILGALLGVWLTLHFGFGILP